MSAHGDSGAGSSGGGLASSTPAGAHGGGGGSVAAGGSGSGLRLGSKRQSFVSALLSGPAGAAASGSTAVTAGGGGVGGDAASTHASVQEPSRIATIVNPLIRDGAGGTSGGGGGGSGAGSSLSIGTALGAAGGAGAMSPAPRRAPPAETTSIIKQLLFVRISTEAVCAKKHVTVRAGPRGGEMLPPLPLVPKITTRTWLWRRVQRDPHLQDCLDSYFSAESVERKCDKCGKVAAMSVRPALSDLPPVLVVQLKRFEYQPAVGSYVKLSDPVSFPLRELDMSPYVRDYSPARHGPSRYDLCGVVLHMGTPDRGHYTAYARNLSAAMRPPAAAGTTPQMQTQTSGGGGTPSAAGGAGVAAAAAESAAPLAGEAGGSPAPAAATPAPAQVPGEGQWFLYDDSTVTPVSEEQIADPRSATLAYLLFYMRRIPVRGMPLFSSPQAQAAQAQMAAQAQAGGMASQGSQNGTAAGAGGAHGGSLAASGPSVPTA